MAIDLVSFKAQLIRLLRESWPSPQMLAEEVYAVLNQLQDSPDTGPTTLSNDGQQPVLTVQQGNNDTPGIQVDAPGQTPFQIVNKGGVPTFQDPSGNPISPQPSSGGGATPGLVQSGGPGTGPYSVDLYEKGRSVGKTKTVSVFVMQLDSGDTVPAGTWVYVTQEGDKSYSMQPGVWLK